MIVEASGFSAIVHSLFGIGLSFALAGILHCGLLHYELLRRPYLTLICTRMPVSNNSKTRIDFSSAVTTTMYLLSVVEIIFATLDEGSPSVVGIDSVSSLFSTTISAESLPETSRGNAIFRLFAWRSDSVSSQSWFPVGIDSDALGGEGQVESRDPVSTSNKRI